MMVNLFCGDCLDILKGLEDNSIDSCVTDPPYGLSFMGKHWDYEVPQVEIWREVFRVLKPGGHLLSFFGTRTYHRGVIPIEDAGFEIRDQIGWGFGSGFPKSFNISKGIDKAKGVEREVVGTRTSAYGDTEQSETDDGRNLWCKKSTTTVKLTGGAVSEEAKQWEGWGTALKPAWEPIVVARKPIEGTVVNNVLTYGTGGLNIDKCRVALSEGDDPRLGGKGTWKTDKAAKNVYSGGYSGNDIPSSELGRFPANIIHDGSEEVVSMFPNDNARFFYCAKTSKADRGEGNTHPTVKPTELMKYLCRLVTPPDGIVLDPFMGSGSTGKAAILEGFGFIGIEREKEYMEMAKTRIDSLIKKEETPIFDAFFGAQETK